MKNDRWMMLCCGGILLCVCVSPWLPYTEWGILLFSVLSALRLYFANDVITGLDQANPKNRTVQEMAVVCMFFIMMMAVIAALYACGQLQEAVKDKLQCFPWCCFWYWYMETLHQSFPVIVILVFGCHGRRQMKIRGGMHIASAAI